MYGDLKQMVNQAKEEAELRAKQKDIRELSVTELQIEVATLRERCAQLEIRLRENRQVIQPIQPQYIPRVGGGPISMGRENPPINPYTTYSAENIKCSNGTNEFGEKNV